jgi:hypothetical protein
LLPTGNPARSLQQPAKTRIADLVKCNIQLGGLAMNNRLITRVTILAAASVTALSMLMVGAQAEVKKAKAGFLASAHAQVPAPTLAPSGAYVPTCNYVGGPKGTNWRCR